MGYNSYFEIETHPPISDLIINSVYEFKTDSSGICEPEEPCKWYDCKKDILKVSKLHPGTLFIIDRVGEGDGMEVDVERTFTKGSKSYSWKLEYTLPEFDESQLK